MINNFTLRVGVFLNLVHKIYKGFPGASEGFPGGPASKESACNIGDLDLIPGLGRCPEGISCPLQYSGLENSMDCIVLRVTKSWTRLSDFHFSFLAVKWVFSPLILPIAHL